MDTEPANLIAVIHHLRTLISQIKPQGNMTLGEFCVLNLIEKETTIESAKLTPTSLNELLGTKKPATSRMLAVLEKNGYVEKISDEKDHRMCYLQLTNLGNTALQNERMVFHDLMERIATKMGEDEVVKMKELLIHLSEIIEEESEMIQNIQTL